MANAMDDRAEFRRRLLTGLVAALSGWALPWMGYEQTLLTSMPAIPMVMGGFAGFVFPVPKGKFGTRGWGDAPTPLRAGNPLLPQRTHLVNWLAVCTLLGFSGCIVAATTSRGPEIHTQLGMLLAYVAAGLLFIVIAAQRTWLELDADSLRILRHRMLFGLRRSSVLDGSAIRCVACCRASSGDFDVFAFTRDGKAFPMSSSFSGVEDANFQAERLADRLMVPLVEGYTHRDPDSLVQLGRTTRDDAMPYRKDWLPVGVPHDLAAHRGELPPLP